MSNWSFDPLLVWGLYLRGVGLILLISFLSLTGQVVENSGSSAGVGSVARRMRKISDDFPTWKRFLYFPTLLWLSSSDTMLRVITWAGVVSSALVVYGGPWSPWAMLACYVLYLSLDLPMGLVFPWDSLLLETTFLSLFMPATLPLPQLAAVAAPAPLLTWSLRLLFFRVMFGFGKQKFLGSRRQDLAYLRGFLIYQPLLSPAAWYAHKAPLWILKGGVLFMFVCEIPAPFLAFVPGWPSVLAAVATTLLVLGIQLMGNFGYFSVLTVVASLPLLDNVTPGALVLSELFAPGAPLVTHAVIALHTVSSLGVFLWNSWLGQGWTLWSLWSRMPRWFQPIIGFYRLMQPLRWLHP
ncbi:MAG: lipase maturation factor family protein [Polyangiales bacterium]